MSGPKVKSQVATGVGGSAGPGFAADRRLCRSAGQKGQLSGRHGSQASVVDLPSAAGHGCELPPGVGGPRGRPGHPAGAAGAATWPL